jgi:hypothetical protein
MQLVAYGAQDVYLTGNAQITYFKVVYRRHTNFSTENIEHPLTNAGFSNTAYVVVTRNADLITKVYLKVKLPSVSVDPAMAGADQAKFAWVRKLGHALLEYYNVDIGGTTMDKQYSDWLNIWQELTLPTGQKENYNKMIGDVPKLTRLEGCRVPGANGDGSIKDDETLYIPLQLWFCRNNGLALPLIALQYHEVRLNFKFRALDECCLINRAMGSTKKLQFNGSGSSGSGLDAYVAIEYIYLDSDERRRFAQVGHEYLIEQTQFSNDLSVGTTQVSQQMFFNHPTKMVNWALKNGSYQGGQFLAYSHSKDWSQAIEDAAQNVLLSQLMPGSVDGTFYFSTSATVVSLPGAAVAFDATSDQTASYVRGANGLLYERVHVSIASLNAPATGTNGFGYRVVDATSIAGANQQFMRPGAAKTAADDMSNRSVLDCTHYVVVTAAGLGAAFGDVASAAVHASVSVNKLSIIHLSRATVKYATDLRPEFMKASDVTVWQHHNYGLLIDGTVNPVVRGNIKLNGHDRFQEKDGNYFNYVQHFQSFEESPCDGINTFAFGIKPAQHQPNGACNMSRIDTALLNFSLEEPSGGKSKRITTAIRNELLGVGPQGASASIQNTRLIIFAFNYNVLRVMSGMGGVAYSN